LPRRTFEIPRLQRFFHLVRFPRLSLSLSSLHFLSLLSFSARISPAMARPTSTRSALYALLFASLALLVTFAPGVNANKEEVRSSFFHSDSRRALLTLSCIFLCHSHPPPSFPRRSCPSAFSPPLPPRRRVFLFSRTVWHGCKSLPPFLLLSGPFTDPLLPRRSVLTWERPTLVSGEFFAFDA
jgi:hypothetical protein